MPEKKSHKAARGQTIDRLYAWIAIEPDGGEGVLGIKTPEPSNTWYPLVGADRERMEQYQPYAEMIAQASGQRVYMRLFHAGPVIDQYDPKPERANAPSQ